MRKLLSSPLTNVLLLTVSWALQIFVAKLGFLHGAQPFTFSVQTVVVTLILLSLYILPKNIREIKRLAPKTFLWLVLAGGVSGGLGSLLSNTGIQLTTAINAGFLFQFDIALTIIIAWIMLKEKIDLPKIITLAVITIGVFLLTTKGNFIIPHKGDIFVLLASACFALSSVIVRMVLRHSTVKPEVVSFFRGVAGLLVFILFIFFSPLYPSPIKNIFPLDLFNFHQIVYVLFNSVFVIGIIIFLNRTLKLASASYTAMMASATPVLVSVFSLVFLKETLVSIQVLGALLILLGGLITHFLKVDRH